MLLLEEKKHLYFRLIVIVNTLILESEDIYDDEDEVTLENSQASDLLSINDDLTQVGDHISFLPFSNLINYKPTSFSRLTILLS